MSNELNRLIDAALEYTPALNETLQAAQAADPNPYDIAFYKQAAKDRIQQAVYQEIEKELKESVLCQVRKEVQEQAHMQKIRDVKIFTISGFVLAFFVGLLVNQITELIGILKGSVDSTGWIPTVWITLGLVVACLLITFVWFVQQALHLIEDYRKDKHDT